MQHCLTLPIKIHYTNITRKIHTLIHIQFLFTNDKQFINAYLFISTAIYPKTVFITELYKSKFSLPQTTRKTISANVTLDEHSQTADTCTDCTRTTNTTSDQLEDYTTTVTSSEHLFSVSSASFSSSLCRAFVRQALS